MRIAQIVLPDASDYERKSQRADHAALVDRHDVTLVSLDAVRVVEADIAHVYAGDELPTAAFVKFPFPYVSSAPMRSSRWSWRGLGSHLRFAAAPVAPRAIVSPLGNPPLPEVVEERYFSETVARDAEVKIVGSFDRPSVRNSVDQTLARIHRFRSDVEWQIYREPPSPTELSGVDLWVDPAVEENDLDGFVAEALVVGLSVVATRTPINVLRLEKGRTGFLTPPRDPNEMTHAILTALFKSEVAQSRQLASRQTVSKFRARHRLRILTRIYDALIPTTP